ncbi:MAG: L-threonylcarbamoyladenylate synthase, partial [Verrucomicrobiota bacterium]
MPTFLRKPCSSKRRVFFWEDMKSVKTKLLKVDKTSIEVCSDLLNNNELVAVPTETVYGLAANALNVEAVRKIFSVKGRPLIDPLITHFSSVALAEKHIYKPKILNQLSEAFWPGPLTVIVRKRNSIPDIVTAGLDSVAIRIPGHPAFRMLLEELDFPLAAPSANPFGYVSPTNAQHVLDGLGDRVPAILDAGPTSLGIESTIIDIREEGAIKILRPGPISKEQITEMTGIKVRSNPSFHKKGDVSIEAPGMLKTHYSPDTKLILFEKYEDLRPSPTKKTAVVFQKCPSRENIESNVYWLSENGDLDAIAQNLFRLIRSLDNGKYDLIC